MSSLVLKQQQPPELKVSPESYELRYAHASKTIHNRGADTFLWSTVNGKHEEEVRLPRYQLVASESYSLVVTAGDSNCTSAPLQTIARDD